MTQRLLRAAPAAILMTTALAWNLPAAAQAGNPPPTGLSAPSRAPAPTGQQPGTALPPALQPSMPALPASDAASAAASGQPRAPAASQFGPRQGDAPAPTAKP
jgi:hypothetical protein